jgi:hypothetical protein
MPVGRVLNVRSWEANQAAGGHEETLATQLQISRQRSAVDRHAREAGYDRQLACTY